MLTQKHLKEVLHYNPDTGIFVWKISARRDLIGKQAGGLTAKGYIRIKIDAKMYMAHVLAWLYVHGVCPVVQIDHKDTIKTHNWISNLRELNNADNHQNRFKANSNSKTGVQNVTYREATGNYQVSIVVAGKKLYQGTYSTLKIAECAALRAKRKHHPNCMI
jgi:hypothetical protein